jgi:hypothetical protein
MDRVEEIETAISNLSPVEYRRLARWFRELDEARWNEQIDRDSASGKLDFLFEEAERELVQGLVRNDRLIGSEP